MTGDLYYYIFHPKSPVHAEPVQVGIGALGSGLLPGWYGLTSLFYAVAFQDMNIIYFVALPAAAHRDRQHRIK